MPAHVRDIDALRNFRVSLIRFLDEAKGALFSLEFELRRAIEWIEQSQHQSWGFKQRQAEDEFQAAKRLSFSKEVKVPEELIARRKLEHCQQQLIKVKHWSTRIRQQIEENHGKIAILKQILETDLPRGVALLEKIATILDDYADVSAASPDSPSSSKES